MAKKPSLFPWADRAADLFDVALAAQQQQLQAMALAWNRWLCGLHGLDRIPVPVKADHPAHVTARRGKARR